MDAEKFQESATVGVDSEAASGQRSRAITAVYLLLTLVLSAYGVFAWVETTRGRQVYPPGSLLRMMLFSGVGALASLWACIRSFKATGPGDLEAANPDDAKSGAESAGSIFRFVPVLSLLGVAIAFTAFAVRQSTTSGRMAFPPFFDDIGYFDDALRRLYVFSDGGFVGFIKDYYREAPHSPTSTILAFLGFSIFGLSDWAPAALNGIIVFGLLILVRYFSHRLSIVSQLASYGFLLAWPYCYLSIVHSIPDFLCCAVMAAGAWFLSATFWAKQPPGFHYLTGGLFGVALLAKPAMYPVTVGVFIGGLVIAAAWAYSAAGLNFLRTEFRTPLLRAVGVAALLSVPHYLVNWRFIQAYIQVNTYGSRRDLWKFEGGVAKQMLYYFTGDGGAYTIGAIFWCWLAIAALAAYIAYKDRSLNSLRAAVGGMAIVGVTHAIVSVTSYKSVFLGMTIPAYLMISGVAMLAFILTNSDWRSGGAERGLRIGGLAIAALAMIQFHPVPMMTILAHVFGDYPRKGVAFVKEGEYRRKYIEQVLAELRRDPRESLRIGVVRGNLFFGPLVFQYQAKKDRTRDFSFTAAQSFGTDEAAFQQETAGLDFVLTFVPSEPGFETRLMESLGKSGEWNVAGRWPAIHDAVEVLLLSHSYNLETFDLHAPGLPGFSGLEGPYPPATHKVRWALGPGFTIPFSVKAQTKYVLHLSGTTSLGGQAIDFYLDGAKVTGAPVANSPQFQEIRVPFTVAAGRHSLELRFATWVKESADRPLAVLVREFRVEAVE